MCYVIYVLLWISGIRVVYNVHTWSEFLVPIVNMIKEGCEINLHCYLFFFYLTSTRKFKPSLWPNLIRWEAQRGKYMFTPHNGSPFFARFTKYRALDTQAANGPSRSSDPITGCPVCPVIRTQRTRRASSSRNPRTTIGLPGQEHLGLAAAG